MKRPRRKFLHLAGGAPVSALFSRSSCAQGAGPLAERLAGYADRLRYGDLDTAILDKQHALSQICEG